ncbi:DUF2474 domain-containing protein [Aquibium sp. LZ166]|uniref:DUF2474 domain-containing protein n=1 Tax=Aquibium pacificus TaxID=3153579 RepID=A0ABV3SEM9_9HYPH
MTERPDGELPRGPQRPLVRKLAWFAGLWLAGVGAVGVVALIIRTWLSH